MGDNGAPLPSWFPTITEAECRRELRLLAKRVIRAIEEAQMFLHSMSDPTPEQKAMQRGASKIARAVREALAQDRQE